MNFKEWWPNNIVENNYVTTDSQQDMKKTLPQDKNKGMFPDNSIEARVLFYFLLLKQKLHFFQGRVLIYILSFPPPKKNIVITSPPFGEVLLWEFYYLQWQVGLCLLYRSYPRKGQMSSINWYTPCSNYFSNSRYTYATCFYKRFLTHSENIKWNNPTYLKSVILINMLSKGCLFVLCFGLPQQRCFLLPGRSSKI